MNWSAIKNYLTVAHFGWLLALFVILWSPFSGGPRVPSLLLAVFGLWLLTKQRGALFAVRAQRRFGVIFLLLWVPVLLSLPASLNPRRTLETALALPLYFLAGVALIEVLRSDGARRRLTFGIAAVLLFWIADGLIQYAVGHDLFGIPLTPDGRMVGPFADNLRIGSFATVLLPLALWLALERHALLALGAVALSAVTVVLTGARMNLVMLAVAGGALLARLPRRWALGTLVIGLVAAAGATALSPAMQERLTRVAAVTAALDFESVDYALSGRLYIWDTAARMVLDRPLTGVGAGAFGAAYDRYASRPGDVFQSTHPEAEKPYHAHQMYVSIAAESGLVGLSAILAAFVLVVRWYARAPAPRRDQAWPYLTGLWVAVFPINSQPVLYTHWWFPPLLLLLCAGLAALDGDGDGNEAVAQRYRVDREAA